VSLYTPRTNISEFDITGDPDNDFNVLALLPDTLNREQVESKIRQNLPKFQVTCLTTEEQFYELLQTNIYDAVLRPFCFKDSITTNSLEPMIEIILSQTPGTDFGPTEFFFVFKDKDDSLEVQNISTDYGGIGFDTLKLLKKSVSETKKIVVFSTLQSFSRRIMAPNGGNMNNFWKVFLKEVLT
jgi:hypothetical protein